MVYLTTNSGRTSTGDNREPLACRKGIDLASKHLEYSSCWHSMQHTRLLEEEQRWHTLKNDVEGGEPTVEFACSVWQCLGAERLPMNGVHPQMSRTHMDEGPKRASKAHPESESSGNREPRGCENMVPRKIAIIENATTGAPAASGRE